MDVIIQMEEDYARSLKEKNELAVLTLRQLKSALTNAEIQNNRQALSSEAVIKVLRSEIKKRKESAELYERGGRIELAEKEKREITLIQKYLPAEMPEDQLREKISAAISSTGATGPQDTGKVMSAVMPEVAQVSDGATVSKLVAEMLRQKS